LSRAARAVALLAATTLMAFAMPRAARAQGTDLDDSGVAPKVGNKPWPASQPGAPPEPAPATQPAPTTEPAAPTVPPVTEPAPDAAPAKTPEGPDGEAADAAAAAEDTGPMAKQEIGLRLGAQIGLTSLTPGGFRLGGVYLYRMDESTWFDGEAATSFGSGDSGCYYDRSESLTLVCHHGGIDGFSMSLAGGLRFLLPQRASGLLPYVRTGLGLSYAGFSADGVSGVAFFGYGGAGGRFRVAPNIAVGAEALLLLGGGRYDSGLGGRFFSGLVVQFGVEFVL
jgi:hypothetical protein